MIRTLINWIISALILWALSLLPFLDMNFTGSLWNVFVVAIVFGLINALIVPLAKKIFTGSKDNTTLLVIAISLVIDAFALLLLSWLVSGFHISFLPTAIIVAIILTVLNAGFSRSKE
ncbi:MAG: phage holin family protein [Firmicutes bacterium]|nr:phage holin family protein [Bacillota bacterium]